MKALFKEMSRATLTYLKRAQKHIEVPFVLIVGKYDQTIPAKATLKFFKKHYEPTQLKDYTFEKSGHLIFEEEPELFIKTILENSK
jgi:pimeloyl-ACP methyl ester carboxylesterase